MSPMEQNEVTDRAKAMSEEEILSTLRTIPSEYLFGELIRRDTVMTNMLNGIQSIMEGGFNEM